MQPFSTCDIYMYMLMQKYENGKKVVSAFFVNVNLSLWILKSSYFIFKHYRGFGWKLWHFRSGPEWKLHFTEVTKLNTVAYTLCKYLGFYLTRTVQNFRFGKIGNITIWYDLRSQSSDRIFEIFRECQIFANPWFYGTLKHRILNTVSIL